MRFSLKSIFNLFKKHEETTLDKWMFWCLWAMVLVIPWFFISASSYPIEFNKTFLFIILTLIITILYFIKSFREKKFEFRRSYLDWGILAFIIFYLVSFVFSRNPYVSLVGISGYYSGGLLAAISYTLFFYLLIQVVTSWNKLKKIITAFQVSALVVVVFNIFQVSNIHLLPWSETQNYSFNLIANSSLTLAIFSVVLLIISLVIFLITEYKWQRHLSLFSILSSLILIFLLDKDWPIYLAVGLIILLLVIISTKNKKAPNYWTILPTIIATLLILFLIFDSGVLLQTQVSENLLLDNQTSVSITSQSLAAAPVWGSGPQTFVYDFSLHRPADFNNNDYWNVQFLKSSNEWLGMLAMLGLGTIVSLAYIFIRLITQMYREYKKNKEFEKNHFWIILVFWGWLLMFFAGWFMPFNFILYFIMWLCLSMTAIIMRLYQEERQATIIFDLKKINIKYWGIMSGFSFAIILLLIVVIFGGRVWLADFHYAKAQRLLMASTNEEEIFTQLEQAVKYNPYESKYYLSLAQGYAAQALLNTENFEINSPEIQSLAQQVVNNISLAKKADPDNSVIYEREAGIYDSLRSIIGNVDELSVKAYEKAIALEPNDPLLWLNLGRSRLLLAQQIFINNDSEASKNEANAQLDQAIQDFEQTRDLRNDLAIDYNIGLVYQTKGELDKALEYYYQELNNNPDSINLRYQIALVYEQQGEIDLAIEQLNKILELDPSNQEIKSVIEELES